MLSFNFASFLLFVVVIKFFSFLLSIVVIFRFFSFLLFLVVIKVLYLILIVCFCYGPIKAVVVPYLKCSIKTIGYVFLGGSYFFLLFRTVTRLTRICYE